MKITDKIHLRAATDADSELAYAVKKAAFSQYVQRNYGYWDEAEQRIYHQEMFASQDLRIVMADRDAVGVMAVAAEPDRIKVNQLMILPEYQGRGIGEHCMALITSEAQNLNIPIFLQVMKVNPRAVRFYKRINFAVVDESETHYRMVLSP